MAVAIKAASKAKVLKFDGRLVRRTAKHAVAALNTMEQLRQDTREAAKRYGKDDATRLRFNAEVLRLVPKAKRRSVSSMLSQAWATLRGWVRQKPDAAGNGSVGSSVTVAEFLARRFSSKAKLYEVVFAAAVLSE